MTICICCSPPTEGPPDMTPAERSFLAGVGLAFSRELLGFEVFLSLCERHRLMVFAVLTGAFDAHRKASS